MRRLLVLMALLPACREPAHISVKLEMACRDLTAVGVPMVQQCTDMQLECATFVEARLYESDGTSIGNILSSKCIALDSLSPRPHNLCDLQTEQATLLDSLPDGKTVKFRMRALLVSDPRNGCNDDIPGVPAPVLLFDGFSNAVTIDGASHQATIDIGTCGSCRYLPPPPPTCNMTCPNIMCPPGSIPYSFPNSTNCCPFGCKMCDPQTDPMCGQNMCDPTTGMNPNCPPVPMICPDGTFPTQVPGDCCLRCSDPNGQPPTVMPDGGITPNN
jgi:hypothetical protein